MLLFKWNVLQIVVEKTGLQPVALKINLYMCKSF